MRFALDDGLDAVGQPMLAVRGKVERGFPAPEPAGDLAVGPGDVGEVVGDHGDDDSLRFGNPD